MRRPALLCMFALLAAGCQLDDHGTRVLLTVSVQSQGEVDDLSFSLWAPGGEVDRITGTRSVGRTAAELVVDPVVLRLGPLPRTGYVLSVVATGPAGERYVATRCYTLTGSLEDTVVLVGPIDAEDADGDGFLADAVAACVEPGPRPCGPADHACEMARGDDCDDASPQVFPGAATLCRNGIDEDCDGMDEECGDADGDGVEACPGGATTGCDCDDANPAISPRAEDVCGDGVDQDCDGVDACCDADEDGYPQCVDPGTGERTGDCIDVPDDCLRQDPPCDPGSVEPATVNPGATETCFDGIDNDCNGAQDEIGACRGPDLDGDGVDVCGMERPGRPCEAPAFDCDSGLGPEQRERCRPVGVDDDLDGVVDEGCPASGDEDGDGQTAPRDCDDTDPLAYAHDPGDPVIERCGDGVAQSCVPGEDVSCPAAADTDGDGWVEPPGCEGNAAVNPDQPEVCNGIDDDCDGSIDEVLDPSMTSGCVEGAPIDFATDVRHCGSCRFNCADEHGAAVDGCLAGVCSCIASGSEETGPCTGGEAPTCCGDGCHDVANDPNNCGGCGIACGLGETCASGRCTCGAVIASGLGEQACPETSGVGAESIACCEGVCRDITTSGTDCGACGVVCGPSAVCSDRICECDPATPDRDDCNGDLGTGGDGCETDLTRDVNHCGRCGQRCAPAHATGVCMGGACAIASCSAGFDNCDASTGNGCETDLRTLTNCGGCGMSCARSNATATCATMSCRIQSCNSGRGNCDGNDGNGCETSFTSTTNCGACGATCGAGETCPASRCTCGADSGSVGAGEVCVGATSTCCPAVGCVNTATDANNCGGCGIACRSNEVCSGSTCRCDGGPACTGAQVCCPGIGCRPVSC